MDTGVGNTLREARNRRKIGLSEVEAATKIRLRYLRAMENDEWDVLPGGVYTRSFVRTYASFLGLDGERLAEEYRDQAEGAPAGEREPRPEPALGSTPRPRRRGRGPSTRAWTAIVVGALIAALVAISLASGGASPIAPLPAHRRRGAFHARAVVPIGRAPRGVTVGLTAKAEVWVCLLDAAGRPLIDGQILAPGARAGPFRSGSFTLAFGNGEVSMKIDEQTAKIPLTSGPIGYTIDSSGRLGQLSESERPTCG